MEDGKKRDWSTEAALNAIDAYVGFACWHSEQYRDEPRDAVLTDLLTELRHYCTEQNLDFEKAVELSLLHFSAEAKPR